VSGGVTLLDDIDGACPGTRYPCVARAPVTNDSWQETRTAIWDQDQRTAFVP